jgi:hypothetical protein
VNADHLIDSRAASIRLAAIVALATTGSVGKWSAVVALPHVQAEFGATRAGASLPYTLTMLGFGAGGIVPSYAVIVREHFPAKDVGTRVGIVLFATLIGMAGSCWVSGLIFDMTGSYATAFLNGVAWNAVNVIIVTTLLLRGGPRRAALA